MEELIKWREEREKEREGEEGPNLTFKIDLIISYYKKLREDCQLHLELEH